MMIAVILCVPVYIASAEHSLSELKLVQRFLRSTVGQEGLTGLVRIALKGDTACSLDNEKVIAT
jgi:hypothetical protein